MKYDGLTPEGYEKELFGNPLPFSIVKENKEEYAKIFASGSKELEKLLCEFWDAGIETWACGNNYDEREENFDFDAECYVQEKYHDYLNANGMSKFFMRFDNYIPQYYSYICLEKDSIQDVNALKRAIKKAIKPFKKECSYLSRDWEVHGREKLSFHVDILRGEECFYPEIKSMSHKEIMRKAMPSCDVFDSYFKAMREGLREYCKEVGIDVHKQEVTVESRAYVVEKKDIIEEKTKERKLSLDQMIGKGKEKVSNKKNDKSKSYQSVIDR